MRTILKTTILLLAAISMTVALNTAMAHECDKQDIIDAAGLGITGSADLCSDSRGLKAQLHVEGLVPGDAYTVWWIYFDDPSLCEVPNECGDADFGGDDPVGVFGRYGSAVARKNGKTHISDRLSGMTPSSGSQVWILLINHGAADLSDGKQLARQLLTPEDPLAGAPHLGIVGGPVGAPIALTIHVME